MKTLVSCSAALFSLVFTATLVLAQDNPLIGRWEARDPQNSGETVTFTFTPTHVEIAGDEPVPYRAERKGDTLILIIQGEERAPPGVVTFVSENEIRMKFPGAPEIAMTRLAAVDTGQQATAPTAGALTGESESTGTLMEELTAAFLPYGVPTTFEPMGQSLEHLLGDGWKIEQVSSGQGGFTIWIAKGGANALCIVVPKPFGEAGSALSDCRRLN